MRWVEFLICLLEAHAQTLQRLAAMFGEEILLHLLEESGEEITASTGPVRLESDWFETPQGTGFSSPYTELESAVHGSGLPATLEFHLWAYPPYRAYIESGEPTLDARIRPDRADEVIHILVEDAVTHAQAWASKLPIAEDFALQAQQAAHMPWLKFRTQVLKKIGKRALGSIK